MGGVIYPTIHPDTWEQFMRLRERLFAAIAKVADLGGKTYEGAFGVTCTMPNYWEVADGEPDTLTWNIHLDCYLVGPHRHYDWSGDTFKEALEQCQRDVDSWIREEAKCD